MAKTNVRRGDKGSGADFNNLQRAVDEGVNERIKSENESDSIDPREANRKDAEQRPGPSQKKTGRSKHWSYAKPRNQRGFFLDAVALFKTDFLLIKYITFPYVFNINELIFFFFKGHPGHRTFPHYSHHIYATKAIW